MKKPLTVAREDFIADLADLINTSHLPAFIIIDILKENLSVLDNEARRQYASDKKMYDDAMRKESEVEDGGTANI